MNRNQRREEMYVCMEKQGYAIITNGFIGFDLLYIMVIRKILDKEFREVLI